MSIEVKYSETMCRLRGIDTEDPHEQVKKGIKAKETDLSEDYTICFQDHHEKVQFLWQEGCRIGSQKKDYVTAISLIIEALNIVERDSLFDIDYKRRRSDQFHRRLAILSLKAGDLKSSLQYAKLCNRPDILGDVYYEMKSYEECLDAYTALSKPREIYPGLIWDGDEKISRYKIANVVKAFYGLNKEDPIKYNVEGLKKHYNWLFEQVIFKFNTLDNAFKYYHCDKIIQKQQSLLKKQVIPKKDVVEKTLKIFETHKSFKKCYSDKIDLIGTMINRSEFKLAREELIKLLEAITEHEKNTKTPIMGLSVTDINLITDIAETYLLTNEFDKAIEWTFDHINKYYGIVDYYLNLKFLLNKDINGKDLVALGFSSEYRDNVASVNYRGFYTPSSFAIRHKESIIEICEKLYKEYRQSLGKPYLNHIYEKFVNEKIPLGSYGPEKNLYRHAYSLFEGIYGRYKLKKDIILSNVPSIIRLNEEIPFICSEGSWIHISFGGCEELIKFVSEINFKSENIYRLDKGIPERGKGWPSENEIYAFVKELFNNYEIIHQSSPEWLSPKHLDIYIPHLRFAIEYQGRQHYEPFDFFGGEDKFLQLQVRDKIKAKLCKNNNVTLLYVRYDDENPEQKILDFIRDNLKTQIPS